MFAVHNELLDWGNRLMDRQKDEWMNRWMDEQMDERQTGRCREGDTDRKN